MSSINLSTRALSFLDLASYEAYVLTVKNAILKTVKCKQAARSFWESAHRHHDIYI